MKKRGRELSLKELRLQMILGILLILFVLIIVSISQYNNLNNFCNNINYDGNLFSSIIYPPIKPIIPTIPVEPITSPTNIFCTSDAECGAVEGDFGLRVYTGCAECDLIQHMCVKKTGLHCANYYKSGCMGTFFMVYFSEDFCDNNFICTPKKIPQVISVINCIESRYTGGGCYLPNCDSKNGCLLGDYNPWMTGKPCTINNLNGMCKEGIGCDTSSGSNMIPLTPTLTPSGVSPSPYPIPVIK
ncbi:MAG: hypothetical protein WC867_08510 [Candidatus Pacearchaeota archaeon]|jgi:hypothetical protein